MSEALTYELFDSASPARGMLDVLDQWQRDFPLVERPFAEIAQRHGISEDHLLNCLEVLAREGVVGRVGATIRPNTVGVSLLAAMSVPPERLDDVARIVNAEPGVNHNYEREHALNLWFVIAAPDDAELGASLDRIRAATGLDVLELPLERAYFIDLGFGLGGANKDAQRSKRKLYATAAMEAKPVVDRADLRLLCALEHGLALVSRPYAALGALIGLGEADVLARIERLIDVGVITRFGFILRHRRLGYRANAMVVFDVDDVAVDEIGELFAAQPFVTLCYRRPRRAPVWRYNLFCMIHGQERELVCAQADSLVELGGLSGRAHDMLFSRRCYLQRGTRLAKDGGALREAAQ